MTQLTGFFQGTPFTDTYLGEILSSDAVILSVNNSPVLTGVAATDLWIESLGGNDTVEAILDISTAQVPPLPVPLNASGIGMEMAAVSMGEGSDTLSILSDVFADGISTSIGWLNSKADMGTGNDFVTIQAIAETNSSAAQTGTTATGASSSKLFTRNGNDTIQIEAESSASNGVVGAATATGITNTRLWAAAGADAITITSQSMGMGSSVAESTSYGVTGNSIVHGGGRSDTITISAETSTIGQSNPESEAVGLGQASTVKGGSGNDVITVSTSATGSISAVNLSLYSHGIDGGSTMAGGNGADTIQVNAHGQGGGISLYTSVIGVNQSSVSGDNGNDTLEINVSGSSNPNNTLSSNIVKYYGIFQSTIEGGQGNDAITINVTGVDITGSVSGSVGVRQGTLEGGQGNDNFFVRGVNLDLNDAVINGGSETDIFDTGMGNAQISGGDDTDLIVLDFFDDATMDISLLGADSIQITGTENKTGDISNWTQTITDVEKYQVAGTNYSAADVVNLLS